MLMEIMNRGEAQLMMNEYGRPEDEPRKTKEYNLSKSVFKNHEDGTFIPFQETWTFFRCGLMCIYQKLSCNTHYSN